MTGGRWLRVFEGRVWLIPHSWQPPSGVDHLRGSCLYMPARRPTGFLEVPSLWCYISGGVRSGVIFDNPRPSLSWRAFSWCGDFRLVRWSRGFWTSLTDQEIAPGLINWRKITDNIIDFKFALSLCIQIQYYSRILNFSHTHRHIYMNLNHLTFKSTSFVINI